MDEEEESEGKDQEEKYQDEAIAEAIAEEETLSKQIEEEESKIILVETDEGESDYGVSLILVQNYKTVERNVVVTTALSIFQ